MKKILILISIFFLFISCASQKTRQDLTTNNFLITEKSAGNAIIGQKVLDFKTKHTNRIEWKKNYRSNYNAWIVFKNKKSLFAFSYPAKTKTSSATEITTIEIKNPAFKTKSGIHAGMTISDAVKIFGKATITIYSSIEDSPEYVTFENYKKGTIQFRVKSLTKSEAGKYMQNEGGIISSEKIYPDSYISCIIIKSK